MFQPTAKPNAESKRSLPRIRIGSSDQFPSSPVTQWNSTVWSQFSMLSRHVRIGTTMCCGLLLFGFISASHSFLLAKGHEETEVQDEPNAIDKSRCTFVRQAVFFCTWPENSFKRTQNDFVLAILGDEACPELMEKLVQRLVTVNGHRIVLERHKELEKVPTCQLLYLTAAVSAEVQKQAIEKFRGQSVLLIGESTEFTRWGGCIGLVAADGTLKKEFNTVEIKTQAVIVDLRLQRDGSFVETIPLRPGDPKPPRESDRQQLHPPIPQLNEFGRLHRTRLNESCLEQMLCIDEVLELPATSIVPS